MRILVTGGAGFVGSVLCPMLLQRDYKVRVVDNLMYGINGLFNCFNHENFEFIKGDIRDEVLMRKVTKDMDCVIHLAAIVGFPACKQNKDEATSVNSYGTQVVAEQTPKSVPLIFASTGSVYGAIEDVCGEDTKLNPLTIYGNSKALAEIYVQKRENFVIFRYATSFGISPRMRLDLLINDFCFRAVKERNLIVYEKDFRRTFLYVTDMAYSFVFAIENVNRIKNEIFNVGDKSMNCSKEYIAKFIKKRVLYYLHFADTGQHDEDKRDYEVNYLKIKEVGFKIQVSLEEGINRLIKLFQYFDLKEEYSNA